MFLGKALTRLDTIKFFIQLAWENKLIPNEHYITLSEKFEEIGKMLGGWEKGLKKKTPTR